MGLTFHGRRCPTESIDPPLLAPACTASAQDHWRCLASRPACAALLLAWQQPVWHSWEPLQELEQRPQEGPSCQGRRLGAGFAVVKSLLCR